jgi:DNA polymerase-3 subunit gamma/tau
VCDACTSIADGSAVDVIELDAASHRGVDDIDSLRDGVKYPPMRLRYKVYVIDEAHQLSSTAKDAFLKTLEEPPAHAIFILATTEAHEIPLTIRSRCQQFDFRRGSVADIATRLRYVMEKEGREADDAALQIVARGAQGSWRDSLSLLEQVLSYSDGRLTAEQVNTVLGTVDEDMLFQISGVIASDDAAAAFELAGRIIHEGKDVRELMKAIAGHFRDLLLASVDSGSDTSLRAGERARQFSRDRMVSLVEIFSSAEKELRWSDQHRLALEMAFLKAMSSPVIVAASMEASYVPQPSVASPTPAAVPPSAEPAAGRPTGHRTKPQTPTTPQSADPQPAEPVMETPPPSGDLAVGQVRSLWPRVISHIRDVQGKKLFLGVLREARVVSVDGSVVCIGFDPRFSFHVENVQKPSNVEIITKALSAVMGRKLGVKAVVMHPQEHPSDAGVAGSDALTVSDSGGNIIHDVLDIFGGSVVEGPASEN